MSKLDFECQNTIFRLSSNVKIGFWISKYDFPTQFECQNRIWNVKIRFSDSVRISKNEKRKTKNEKRKAKNEKRKAKNENQTNFTLLNELMFSVVLIWCSQLWEWENSSGQFNIVQLLTFVMVHMNCYWNSKLHIDPREAEVNMKCLLSKTLHVHRNKSQQLFHSINVWKDCHLEGITPNFCWRSFWWKKWVGYGNVSTAMFNEIHMLVVVRTL